jgi:hypothetical protein
MLVDRRLLLIAIVPMLLAAAPAVRAQSASWDGAWKGAMGRLPGEASPISVTIAGGKVTSYMVRGAPFDIQYSNVTPTAAAFGDRDHYGATLTRTSNTTAQLIVHGRIGVGRASLTKQ